ncbi:hypothetical protein PSM7751_01129 [Pseudooceanicola marinus]|uniref:Uncharacterized protein n=1 Tax=Pseudooceanicola marinus TaxID=396013 RepID=A0A1X6YRB9_9RHOB|nr:hypothetical protein [Pseudooceanicola marinus]PJE29595.1 hypothetical protein CVM50_13975 [Pseudooceanicola marinus]SLN28625.1 hypothetical protein PSM7751_01129 [Pseudooceanicola marinus]
MTRFEIDLNTKIISSDTDVYMARAGKQGHLFAQVLAEKAIGPDLPNLDLDLSKGLDEEKYITAKINRSRQLSRWIQSSATSRGEEPSKDLGDYENDKKRSGHAQIEGIVRTYFKAMKAGDVLVIPDPQLFGRAILAEVLPLEKTAKAIPGAKRYDGYTFQGRKFGHFKRVRMMDLPRSVIELARAPTGLAKIADPRVKNRIFEMCFTDFALDDVFFSQIITTKPDFHPFDANVLNAFVRMIAQNVELLQNEGEDAQLKSLVEAAFVTGGNGPSVKININSPGHLAIIDRSVIPLVAGVVLGILVAVGFDHQAIAQETVEVVVTNSRVVDALDLCSQEVGRLTQSMLRFLPEDDFQQACDLLRRTHETTGAESKVTVKTEE